MSLENDIDDLRAELTQMRERVNAIDHLDDIAAAGGIAQTIDDMIDFMTMPNVTRTNIRRYVDDLLKRLRRK